MPTNADNLTNDSNVINIFTKRPLSEKSAKIVRIAPELDGIEMLYSNDSSSSRLYTLKIVCWALKEDGEIVGMVPWLDDMVACTEINDPLNGHWEGYRDSNTGQVFYSVPEHKATELKTAASYYQDDNEADLHTLQEIPDMIGTHAVLTNDGFRNFILAEVLSWRLRSNGKVEGMLINEEEIKTTPVLPGDPCLYPAQGHVEFKYFFQHRIANKIKAQDPDALAAMSMLIEK